MKFFSKYRVRILQFLNHFIFIDNYSISYYFSRFGNNLQQIAVGILYSQRISGNFYVQKHPLVKNFSIINNQIANYFFVLKKHYRFFYFKEKKDFPKYIDASYIENNIEDTFKSYLRPNIPFLKELQIPEDTLVIHIRSGDIFYKPILSYFQNPINYYKTLIQNYEKVILVTSAEKNNPVVRELLKETKVTIHSTTLQEDFNILFNAINLATSGVGTFPIAAALLSNKLRNFYYTDLYSDEHLNPKMVTNKRVNHFKYKVEEGYKEKYLSEEKIDKLILNDCINVDKL